MAIDDPLSQLPTRTSPALDRRAGKGNGLHHLSWVCNRQREARGRADSYVLVQLPPVC